MNTAPVIELQPRPGIVAAGSPASSERIRFSVNLHLIECHDPIQSAAGPPGGPFERAVLLFNKVADRQVLNSIA